jgi:hypothetical protein
MFIARTVYKRKLPDHALRTEAIPVRESQCSIQNMLVYVMNSATWSFKA